MPCLKWAGNTDEICNLSDFILVSFCVKRVDTTANKKWNLKEQSDQMMYLILYSLLLGVTPHTRTQFADVTDVQIRKSGDLYSFQVTLSSPDTGCDQYADWWEVVSEEGELLYRRILSHSHTSEQPFTRGGGSLKLNPVENVWIRAHMNNTGYGGLTMYGNASDGFQLKEMAEGFTTELDQKKPLPDGCRF